MVKVNYHTRNLKFYVLSNIYFLSYFLCSLIILKKENENGLSFVFIIYFSIKQKYES